MIELARMLVHPHCPMCGEMVLFEGREREGSLDELVPVFCQNPRCRWEGVSRRTVPQPKIVIETQLVNSDTQSKT